jgi:hypothetical protein
MNSATVEKCGDGKGRGEALLRRPHSFFSTEQVFKVDDTSFSYSSNICFMVSFRVKRGSSAVRVRKNH